MKEVEMKAWLRTADERAKVKKFFDETGKYLKKATKQDIYFARPDAETFDFRIRDVDGKYIVTKKNYKLVGNLEENDELEFEVSDKNAFIELTERLGYVVFLEKTKISEVYDLGNHCTAEIVEVLGLGNFLEIEVLCESEEEIEKAREKIQGFFSELGLIENIERKQYSYLLKSELKQK